MHQTMKTWINSNIKKKLESEGLFIAFWFIKTDITDVSIFSFIAISSVRHPTGSNCRLAKNASFFALWKNDITDVSLFTSYCYFIQEARHRFRKEESNSLAQQTIWLRALNEQTLMRKSLCVYWRKFQSSSLGVCCLNETFLVASCLSTRKKKQIQNNVDNKVH